MSAAESMTDTQFYLKRKLFQKMQRPASSVENMTAGSSQQSTSAEPSASSSRDSATDAPRCAPSPGAISSHSSSSEMGQQHSKRPSRLRSAARAIFFFRRAVSSLARNQASSSASNQRQPERTRRLVRQTTADSVTPSTQFIVPKTNALKLPLVCLIKSVEGELMREVFVHRYELGSYLIESLKVSFGISDCKFFGLKLARTSDDQDDLRSPWLDMDTAVCKQVVKLAVPAGSTHEHRRSIDFYLRIKFYPPSLARVQDPFVRHYLWLQLRRDLRLGKLTSSMNNLTYLMACVLQYELTDHAPDLLQRVPQLHILPNQDLIEHQAVQLWQDQLKGALKHQAQMQFLRAAVILETYGFDYYPVRDHQRQRAYLLGFNYAGVKTIRNGRIAHHFRWQSISKISNERRMIIFHVSPGESSRRKQILGFKCLSTEDCQLLYMRLVEQKVFFTLDLTYFDRSTRRLSYLHESTSEPSDLGTRMPESPTQPNQVERRISNPYDQGHDQPGATTIQHSIDAQELSSDKHLWRPIQISVTRVTKLLEDLAVVPMEQPGPVWIRLCVILVAAKFLSNLTDSISSCLVHWFSFDTGQT